ncbi:MAG: oxidoreductase [Archangium sp.]|nr:oxidoreductase [Archangium sp.]MDP3576166.1 oxidoreductase [Archangium sp.]
MKWTLEAMPSLEGQVWVVTGANSGLGLETVKGLAARGAAVLMACRDPQRAEAAADEVRRGAPNAKLELESLDLASLKSIEAFAARLANAHPVVDGLINNAGIMAIPRRTTADGFEMQLGTNHLGHYALTLRVLPLLEAAKAPRVISVASTAHRMGTMNFDDLMGEKSYSPWSAYGQSKLANLLFTYELHRKLSAAGKRTIAVAAHPGYAATNLQGVGAKMTGSKLSAWFMNVGNSVMAQSATMGALPTLYAATVSEVKGGEYFGPDGFMELKGHPRRCDSNTKSKDLVAAQKLWEASETLTGVRFPA